MVSIIVPNYNHANFLKERIDSILNQTFQGIEIIILDDCSTDHSKEIIEGYRHHPNIFIHYNSKNSGSPFKQWNKGIKLAKGEYIWIAESDDYAEPQFLATLLALIEKGHGLAYCRSLDVDQIGKKKSDYFWADGLDPIRWKNDYENNGFTEIFNYLVYRCTVPNASACIFRKDLAPLDCGFDTMRYCGDWLFWIKLIENSSLAFTSETLSHFRHHEYSTRNKKNRREESRKISECLAVIKEIRHKLQLNYITPEEVEKYQWVTTNFHLKISPHKSLKNRLICYSNNFFPGLYPFYQKIFSR